MKTKRAKTKKPKTVRASELETLRMTCGNEKKYTVVIHCGHLKRWVGFGWVGEGKATAEDRKRWPIVVDAEGKEIK